MTPPLPKQLLQQIPDAKRRAIVDAIVRGLLGVGKPTPTAWRFESEVVSDDSLGRCTRRDHLLERGFARTEFHGDSVGWRICAQINVRNTITATPSITPLRL